MTNTDGTAYSDKAVEITSSCDICFQRIASINEEGFYSVDDVPFGGGIRVTVPSEPEMLGCQYVPSSASQITVDVTTITLPEK